MEEILGVIREHGKKRGANGVELRRQCAAAVAALTTEDVGNMGLLRDAKDGVELVSFLATQSESARDALATLVNLTAWAHGEGEPIMEAIVERIAEAGALKEAMRRALESSNSTTTTAERSVVDAALRLLQNASTRETGWSQLTGSFEALLKRFLSCEELEASDDVWARFGCCLQNATATSVDARKILLKRSTGLLKQLLGGHHLSADAVDRRRGAAAAFKHCSLDKDSHFYLFDDLGMGKLIVEALAQPDDVEKMIPEDREHLISFLGRVPVTRREPDQDVALLLLEALYCFCGTRRLRKILKKAGVYDIVRDADLFYQGVEDSEPEPEHQGILVTSDFSKDEPENDDTSRIARVCADLADMMLRDEENTSTDITCDTAFAEANVDDKQQQTDDAPTFDGLKSGFLAKVTHDKKKKNVAPKSFIVSDEDILKTVDTFDLPD